MSTLTEETISLVESTTPILQEHGLAITTHFYDRLLREYPTLAPMFPEKGLQAERLAGAVLAYSKNIRNLDALAPAIQRIAAKHVEAGVEPAQYDVVGELLLGSLVEVLGEIDGAIVDAWGQAYAVLSAILITSEAEMAEAS